MHRSLLLTQGCNRQESESVAVLALEQAGSGFQEQDGEALGASRQAYDEMHRIRHSRGESDSACEPQGWACASLVRPWV